MEQDLNARLAETLKSLEETEEISTAINHELLSQRERLEKTRNKANKIDSDLAKCEKTTNNITSYWNGFLSLFTKSEESAPEDNANHNSVILNVLYLESLFRRIYLQ